MDVCVDCGSINTVYLGFKGELKVVLISIPGVKRGTEGSIHKYTWGLKGN